MTTPQRLSAQGYVQGEPYTRPDGLTITPWYGQTIVLVQTLPDGTDICYGPLPQQEDEAWYVWEILSGIGMVRGSCGA